MGTATANPEGSRRNGRKRWFSLSQTARKTACSATACRQGRSDRGLAGSTRWRRYHDRRDPTRRIKLAGRLRTSKR